MAQWIWIWPLVVAAVCALSMMWLQAQPVHEPGMPPPRLTPVAFLVGWVLRPGVRLARGAQWRSVAYSWFVWTAAGWLTLAVLGVWQSEVPGRPLILGVLCGVGIGMASFAVGILAGLGITKAAGVSSFEGRAGFYTVAIGLMAGLVGLVAGTIAMTIYFGRP